MDIETRPVDHIFPGRPQAIAAKVCRFCGKSATEFRDELSRKDYGITAMCQKCQDDFYGS